jgi:RHS repeat-associated protein
VDYEHLVTGEVKTIRENGAASGVGVLATYAYDPATNAGQMGLVTSIAFGNGTSRSFGHDAVLRLSALGHAFPSSTYDQSLTFAHNPAGQIRQTTRSNDLYAWTGHANRDTVYEANGLNQYSKIGTTQPSYDAKGNLSWAGATATYGYTAENRLATSPAGNLGYDPLGRLYIVGGEQRLMSYDGPDLVSEHANSSPYGVLRRYVHGPGLDDPIVWYEGSGTGDRRFLQTDERGSVTAVTNSSGGIIATNSYDEYGIPASTNLGRFQYTGQTWLPGLGLYNYKARMYAPKLGRFLQPDPVGHDDGMNMYAYVGADPVNFTDPSGAFGAPANLTEELEAYGGSGRLWDWMGMGAQAGGGRLEAIAYEKRQSELAAGMARLQQISSLTGISPGCLLSEACTNFMLGAADGYKLGEGWRSSAFAVKSLFGRVGSWVRRIGGVVGEATIGLIFPDSLAPGVRIGEIKADKPILDTINRISSGQFFPHRNDGSVYRNFDGLLPTNFSYTEWVVPTPGINHAGMQRLVISSSGVIYYTGSL